MSVPIHFKGTDYDSVEAMPPHIRRAYKQTQRDKARHERRQADDGDQAGEAKDTGSDPPEAPLQPAWGGPRPDESIPAPKEFEAVAGLVPVTGACAGPRSGGHRGGLTCLA